MIKKIKKYFNDLRYTRKILFFILENQYTMILCIKALARNYHGGDIERYLYWLNQNMKDIDVCKRKMREMFQSDYEVEDF